MTEFSRDGYTDVPSGSLATVATFLQMLAPPPTRAVPDLPRLELRRDATADLAAYRDLFRRIGEPWLWTSRLRMPDPELASILTDRAVEIFVAVRDGEPAGLLELDFRIPGEVELAFFGLVPEAVGTGAGRWLMDHALRLAWREGITRVWVHTCTIDHPAALAFYVRSGFVPYARKVECFPDPRLAGLLSRDAAPHVPLIES